MVTGISLFTQQPVIAYSENTNTSGGQAATVAAAPIVPPAPATSTCSYTA